MLRPMHKLMLAYLAAFGLLLGACSIDASELPPPTAEPSDAIPPVAQGSGSPVHVATGAAGIASSG